MRYKLLGKSGLKVSELCLGTMTFGTEWGFGVEKDECRKVYDTFRDAGGNFIDTANLYTQGTSEKFVGEFIKTEREAIVLATKYTLSLRPGDHCSAGNNRKNMMQSVEESLRRLKTDYIDLLWVHMWDHLTPVDEVMRGLDDLVRSGKVMYVGISDTPAWIVSQANTLADLRGWSPFVGLQIEYSLIERTPERDLLPMAEVFGLSITPWGILGGGVITGKYNPENKDVSPKRMKPDNDRMASKNLNIAREVMTIAESIGKTSAQVAINWMLTKNEKIIPILGARTDEHLRDNLESINFELNLVNMAKLDKSSEVDLGFPHEFLQRDYVRNHVYAGMYDNLKL